MKRYVVTTGQLSQFPRGCRVSQDDLFDADDPGRDGKLARLLRVGAIQPETDPEAAAIPEAHPIWGWHHRPPVNPDGYVGDLTVSLEKGDKQ